MTTYREFVFMVLDQFKLSNDDSYFDIPHVVWLTNKYKALLLEKYYIATGKAVPEHLLHVVCMDLDAKENCVSGTEVRSVYKLPKLVTFADEYNVRIYPLDDAFNASEWTYVSKDRFSYVGKNKWLKHIVYFTIFNQYLYVKSANSGYEYLKKVMVRGLFEDHEELFKQDEKGNYIYQCNKLEDECPIDPLDVAIGIEDFMIPGLLESVIRDLTPDVYRPIDILNNAKDNLSGLQGGNPDRGYNQQNPTAVNMFGQPGQVRNQPSEEQYE